MTIPWLRRRSTEDDGTEAQTEAQAESAPSVHGTDPGESDAGAARNRSRLRIDMPPTNAPFTLAQNATPGWETPWTSAHPNRSGSHLSSIREQRSEHEEKFTAWQMRRKRLRAYMMYNLYVPLVSNFTCLRLPLPAD